MSEYDYTEEEDEDPLGLEEAREAILLFGTPESIPLMANEDYEKSFTEDAHWHRRRDIFQTNLHDLKCRNMDSYRRLCEITL